VSRHFLWLGLTGRRRSSKRRDFFCLVLDLELELGRRSYVGLLLESCLAWGVNCSRGAFVGMEGDSLLVFITRSSRLAAWCVSGDYRRVCVSWHSTTPDFQGTFRYVPQAAHRRSFARPHFCKPLSGWPDAHTVWAMAQAKLAQSTLRHAKRMHVCSNGQQAAAASTSAQTWSA
jgi:hypothetical protein